jgi:hypothetical protein
MLMPECLALLEEAMRALALGRREIFCFVDAWHVPDNEMPEHKIQSRRSERQMIVVHPGGSHGRGGGRRSTT